MLVENLPLDPFELVLSFFFPTEWSLKISNQVKCRMTTRNVCLCTLWRDIGNFRHEADQRLAAIEQVPRRKWKKSTWLRVWWIVIQTQRIWLTSGAKGDYEDPRWTWLLPGLRIYVESIYTSQSKTWTCSTINYSLLCNLLVRSVYPWLHYVTLTIFLHRFTWYPSTNLEIPQTLRTESLRLWIHATLAEAHCTAACDSIFTKHVWRCTIFLESSYARLIQLVDLEMAHTVCPSSDLPWTLSKCLKVTQVVTHLQAVFLVSLFGFL